MSDSPTITGLLPSLGIIIPKDQSSLQPVRARLHQHHPSGGDNDDRIVPDAVRGRDGIWFTTPVSSDGNLSAALRLCRRTQCVTLFQLTDWRWWRRGTTIPTTSAKAKIDLPNFGRWNRSVWSVMKLLDTGTINNKSLPARYPPEGSSAYRVHRWGVRVQHVAMLSFILLSGSRVIKERCRSDRQAMESNHDRIMTRNDIVWKRNYVKSVNLFWLMRVSIVSWWCTGFA